MTLSALFPVPPEVQQRAWECAHSLATEWLDRLEGAAIHYCLCRLAQGPQRIGWDEARVLFGLYRELVGVRL